MAAVSPARPTIGRFLRGFHAGVTRYGRSVALRGWAVLELALAQAQLALRTALILFLPWSIPAWFAQRTSLRA